MILETSEHTQTNELVFSATDKSASLANVLHNHINATYVDSADFSKVDEAELDTWIATAARLGLDYQVVHDELTSNLGLVPEAAQQRIAETMRRYFPGYAGNAELVKFHPYVVPEPKVFDESQTLDLGDRIGIVQAQMILPRIVVIDNFLDRAECEALMREAQPRLQRSGVVEAGTGNSMVTDYRTSEGMFFDYEENPVVSTIERRIERAFHWPMACMETMQVLRYRPGEEYKPHQDFFDPADLGTPRQTKLAGNRVATVVLYLNEPVRGGGTTFPDAGGLTVQAKQGRAVFFSYCVPSADRRTLHAARPVLEGEKWVAVKWFRRGGVRRIKGRLLSLSALPAI